MRSEKEWRTGFRLLEEVLGKGLCWLGGKRTSGVKDIRSDPGRCYPGRFKLTRREQAFIASKIKELK